MSIKIKGKVLEKPVIQGGMGIGVSLGDLAGQVAKTGAMGTISFVNPGFKETDFKENSFEANCRAFLKELKKAREIAQGKGIIAVNVMEAMKDSHRYIEFAGEQGVDAVVVGAGLPLELPGLLPGEIAIAPIISSSRALKIIAKRWIKDFNRWPDFIVFEGPKAGGHLGFKDPEESFDLWGEVESIISLRDQLADEKGEKIPLFLAGGFGSHEKLEEGLNHGADGIQVGTGFLMTKESGIPMEVKERILKEVHEKKARGEEGVVIIKSPVGMPARAIETPFLEKVKKMRIASSHCVNCLTPCNPKTTPYCISQALIRAVEGDYERGLYFSGADLNEIEKIVSAEERMKEILGENL